MRGRFHKRKGGRGTKRVTGRSCESTSWSHSGNFAKKLGWVRAPPPPQKNHPPKRRDSAPAFPQPTRARALIGPHAIPSRRSLDLIRACVWRLWTIMCRVQSRLQGCDWRHSPPLHTAATAPQSTVETSSALAGAGRWNCPEPSSPPPRPPWEGSSLVRPAPPFSSMLSASARVMAL